MDEPENEEHLRFLRHLLKRKAQWDRAFLNRQHRQIMARVKTRLLIEKLTKGSS